MLLQLSLSYPVSWEINIKYEILSLITVLNASPLLINEKVDLKSNIPTVERKQVVQIL